MSLKRTASLLIATVLITGTLAGCHGSTKTSTSSDTSTPPPASTLLSQAATATSAVKTVHFTLKVDGTIANIPVSAVDGVLTRSGEAKGTATITELGATIQADFVLVGGSFYLKALTGGYQKLPLSSATRVYDPSAILDPNRGISKLLTASASGARTVGETSINGKPAYQVSIKPDPNAMKALIPGADANVTGSLWIDKASSRVVKGVFTIPNSNNTKPAIVTITLDNYDAPVSISAP